MAWLSQEWGLFHTPILSVRSYTRRQEIIAFFWLFIAGVVYEKPRVFLTGLGVTVGLVSIGGQVFLLRPCQLEKIHIRPQSA